MSVVYVVQNQHHADTNGNLVPKFDLRPAEKFGNIVFLLSPSARPFNPTSIVQDLHRRLRDFRPGEDHLLLLGNPALIAWACAVAAHYGGGKVSVLQWDGRSREYTAIPCELWRTN